MKVKVEDNWGEWNVGLTQGVNQYTLSARLEETSGTFAEEDKLTTTVQWAGVDPQQLQFGVSTRSIPSAPATATVDSS